MTDQRPENTSPSRAEVVPGKPGGLGTFGEVFTPSILTILGAIMYLRFGWVVGNVGLGRAYNMISRSLGIEAGGSIGIPLFLAQGLSVALYTVGFAESLVAVFPSLNGKHFFDILEESSAGADLVLMGIARPKEGRFADYYEELRRKTDGLPSTVFVLAAEEIAFREVLLRYDHKMDRFE